MTRRPRAVLVAVVILAAVILLPLLWEVIVLGLEIAAVLALIVVIAWTWRRYPRTASNKRSD